MTGKDKERIGFSEEALRGLHDLELRLPPAESYGQAAEPRPHYWGHRERLRERFLAGGHPAMPEYEPVAKSKRAGEDALRERIPALTEKGVEFVVVSGDMIEGTITATLLERANPGAIAERRESAGKLYNVAEFAAEVARAAVEPIPADHTRLIGDTSSFGA